MSDFSSDKTQTEIQKLLADIEAAEGELKRAAPTNFYADLDEIIRYLKAEILLDMFLDELKQENRKGKKKSLELAKLVLVIIKKEHVFAILNKKSEETVDTVSDVKIPGSEEENLKRAEEDLRYAEKNIEENKISLKLFGTEVGIIKKYINLYEKIPNVSQENVTFQSEEITPSKITVNLEDYGIDFEDQDFDVEKNIKRKKSELEKKEAALKVSIKNLEAAKESLVLAKTKKEEAFVALEKARKEEAMANMKREKEVLVAAEKERQKRVETDKRVEDFLLACESAKDDAGLLKILDEQGFYNEPTPVKKRMLETENSQGRNLLSQAFEIGAVTVVNRVFELLLKEGKFFDLKIEYFDKWISVLRCWFDGSNKFLSVKDMVGMNQCEKINYLLIQTQKALPSFSFSFLKSIFSGTQEKVLKGLMTLLGCSLEKWANVLFGEQYLLLSMIACRRDAAAIQQVLFERLSEIRAEEKRKHAPIELDEAQLTLSDWAICLNQPWEVVRSYWVDLSEAVATEQLERSTRFGAPLVKAASLGNDEVLRNLIAYGVNVNAPDKADSTALMLAVRCGNAAGVQALMAAGANLNLRNKYGVTVLMVAARYSDAASVQALIAAGAEIDLRGKGGGTALMVAARYSDAANVQALIDAGAKVDAQQENGGTALMVAAQSGDAASVQALIAAGAEIGLRGKDDWTALMVAAQFGDAVRIELLTNALLDKVFHGGPDIKKIMAGQGGEEDFDLLNRFLDENDQLILELIKQMAEAWCVVKKENEVAFFKYNALKYYIERYLDKRTYRNRFFSPEKKYPGAYSREEKLKAAKALLGKDKISFEEKKQITAAHPAAGQGRLGGVVRQMRRGK
ncbi:MAG: ankyrin repeat domain-containing protein [Gammaproteobacteria bacterium]|nr:ankyrin repeat domain-containing protein [Gammaproteobacteria bacterium]